MKTNLNNSIFNNDNLLEDFTKNTKKYIFGIILSLWLSEWGVNKNIEKFTVEFKDSINNKLNSNKYIKEQKLYDLWYRKKSDWLNLQNRNFFTLYTDIIKKSPKYIQFEDKNEKIKDNTDKLNFNKVWKLPFISRLQNTKNVAEDLNNPANLIAGGIWDEYAIWKIKSANGRIFLVFKNIKDWFKAMAADIKAKQKWYSQHISKNANLEEFLSVWTDNWDWDSSKKTNYIKIVLNKLKITYWKISLSNPFNEIDSYKLAIALAKAEWFKRWNDLYSNM